VKITITHARYTPRWESLQTIMREATNDPKATLVRISRVDGGADYRKPGIYELGLRQDNGVLLCVLEVTGVGQSRPYDRREDPSNGIASPPLPDDPQLRANLRNYLLPMNSKGIRWELENAIEQGDALRARYCQECLDETLAEELTS
jgi:hypothetical protein